MPNLWHSVIAGHLGRDAETKQINGNTVVEWTMAVTHKHKDAEITTWIKCAYWGDRAAKVAQYLTKGKAVHVIGGTTERAYTGKDGQAKRQIEVRVDTLTLLGDGRKSESPRPAAEPAPAASAPAGGGVDDSPPFMRKEDWQ